MPAARSRGIVTPEAVLLEFDTASVGSRALASAIDVVPQLLCAGLLLFVYQLLFTPFEDLPAFAAVSVIVALVFFGFTGYRAVLETTSRGQTLGKMALGLRVVTREGAPIRFRHAAIRSVLTVVDFFLPPLGVVATLTVLLTPHDQRLGDLVAGTVVVRERNVVAAGEGVAMTFPTLPGFEHYVAGLDVSALTVEQYQLLRSFLTRVASFTPEARAALAVRLANPVARRLRHTPPPGLHPELFLASVASAYQRRHRGPAAGWS